MRLVFYEPDELEQIVSRGARAARHSTCGPTALPRSRAARAARRASRCACCAGSATLPPCEGLESIDVAAADAALLRLDVDGSGLDGMDRRYLRCIAEHYGGGPVGVETLAAALGDERDVIEEVIEPYLIQEGFVQRTPRGRLLTRTAFRHLDLPMPAIPPAQLDLLAGSTCEVENAP